MMREPNPFDKADLRTARLRSGGVTVQQRWCIVPRTKFEFVICVQHPAHHLPGDIPDLLTVLADADIQCANHCHYLKRELLYNVGIEHSHFICLKEASQHTIVLHTSPVQRLRETLHCVTADKE